MTKAMTLKMATTLLRAYRRLGTLGERPGEIRYALDHDADLFLDLSDRMAELQTEPGK